MRSRIIEAVVAVCLALAAAGVLVWHARYMDPPAVDDAGTSTAYALTLFSGHSLRLTAWSQPVEGFSNPLWTVLTGLSLPLHVEPVKFAQVLGAAFGVLGALTACLWGPLGESRLPRIEDAAPVSVAAVTTPFAFWIAGGLETGLQVFLMALAGLLVCRQRTANALWGLVFALLALTHPEGALYSVAAIGVVPVVLVVERRWPRRGEWLAAAIFIALVGGYEAFRLAFFASWLPNTYYAKLGWDFNAKEYIHNFLKAYEWLGKGAMGLLLIGFFGRGSISRAAWCSLVFLASVFCFTWVAHGDWMREWRFLAPAVPFMGTAIAAGLAAIRREGPRVFVPRWVSAPLTLAVVAPVVYLTAKTSEPRSIDLKKHPEYSVPAGKDWSKGLLRWTTGMGLLHPLIAVPDLGGFSLTFREAEIIDDAGLADYAVARDRTSHRAIEDYLVSEGPPDVVNVHGPSGFLSGFSRLMPLYSHAEGFDWKLKGLTREEDPRCPGGKTAVLALSPDALATRVESALLDDRPADALRLWRCALRYHPEAQLPSAGWRNTMAKEAVRRSKGLKDRPELALRYMSFATVVSGGDAWLRRRTEEMRRSLFH